jgi:alpha-glucosidase
MASDKKVLLKSSINPDKDGGWLTQHVWSKKTVFLDFMDRQASEIWMHGINALFEDVEYDGLWLDMNEATGFCDGECINGVPPTPTPPTPPSAQRRSLKEKLMKNTEKFINEEIIGDPIPPTNWYESYPQNEKSTYFLPFVPGKDNLDHMSLSLNATHVDGTSEYNLHSLFGHA